MKVTKGNRLKRIKRKKVDGFKSTKHWTANLKLVKYGKVKTDMQEGKDK